MSNARNSVRGRDGPVLALEASSLRASAALLAADGSLLGAWRQAGGSRGTAPLAAAAGELLAERALAAADLLGVAVGTGPGSYTGLRAAIALARALTLAANVPLVGVPSSAAAARAVLIAEPEVGTVTVLVDARRGEAYRADYVRGGGSGDSQDVVCLAPPRLVPVGSAETAAEGALRAGATRIVRDPVPEAYHVGWLGRSRLDAGGDEPAAVLPLYLKRSHAEIALEERSSG